MYGQNDNELVKRAREERARYLRKLISKLAAKGR